MHFLGVGVDSFDGPVEVVPTIGVPLDEDDAYNRPLDAGPAEVGPTLRRIFKRDYNVVDISPALERFPPLRGKCTNIDAHPYINDPEDLDVDAACFMMLTTDLSSMFDIITRPANMMIRVRDSPKFADWLHVISDPIVVPVMLEAVRTRCVAFETMW